MMKAVGVQVITGFCGVWVIARYNYFPCLTAVCRKPSFVLVNIARELICK